ncbi:MAG: GAF domain-containing sensor histidine kinase [Planctomycetota bacterium]|nr:MAG: GAF domain-containing sensor histidine kinase [Planctomycetota bacterium]
MEQERSNLPTTCTRRGQTADATLQFLQTLSLSNLTVDNQQQSLKTALHVITDRFSADNGYILLKSDDTDQLELFTSVHKDKQSEPADTFSNTVIEKVLQTNKAILLDDAMNNRDFAGDPNLQRFNIKAVMCAPVNAAHTAAGVMYLDSSQQQCNWNEENLELMGFVARYTQLALEAVRAQQQRDRNQRLINAGQVSLKISHSVKNIIQLVSGAAEVIDFGLRTNEIHRVKRSWGILKPNLERVKKFMLDMLDFSRERHLELGPCEFNAVIQGAIESLNSQLKQKKTKLHIRIDQQIPLIELDGERIHEMAANLILNAIDIVDEKTGVVSVETKYLKEQSAVQLSVTDNGPGISEEAKEKIFQPFESSKNKLGTGLGLAIAKQIIEQHCAEIQIESEIGKGSTFKVILPAKVIDQQQPQQPPG